MVWELCEQPFHVRSCILHFFPFSAESDHYLQSYVTYLLAHQKTSLASISSHHIAAHGAWPLHIPRCRDLVG